MRRTAARDPVLWSSLAAGLLLRLAPLLRYPALPGQADEHIHLVAGGLVSRLGEAAIGHWGPGYEFFLGGIFAAAGIHPLAAKVVQVLVSTASVGLVYALALRSGGRRAAAIAGGLCAVYPSLVAYSHYLYSETLFLSLLTAGIYALHRRPEAPTRGEQVAAGLCFGLAALTRSTALYFLPCWLAVAALRRSRSELRTAAVVLAVALAVVAPWTLRNGLRYHAFLLVDGTLGETAYIAFKPWTFSRDLGADWRLRHVRERCPHPRAPGRRELPPTAVLRPLFPPDAVAFLRGEDVLAHNLAERREDAMTDWPAVQRCEVAAALAFARDDPRSVLRNTLARVYDFWGPNSYLLRGVRLGEYGGGPLGPRSYAGLAVATVALHVVVVAAALLALGLRGAPRLVPFAALFCAYYTAVHAVAVASSRYRLPLVPLLIAVGSLWLAHPRRPEGPVRSLAVAAALVAFLILSAHYAWMRLG